MHKAELDFYSSPSRDWNCTLETKGQSNLGKIGEKHIVEIKLTQRKVFIGRAWIGGYSVILDGVDLVKFYGDGRPYIVQWRTLAQKEERFREARRKLEEGMRTNVLTIGQLDT